MKRRQFLKGIAAVAAVIAAPFKAEEWTHSIWLKSPNLTHVDPAFRFSALQRVTGRLGAAGEGYWLTIDFAEIEKRVAAHLLTDGEWHQYAQNSRGEMFFDGEHV